MENKQVRRHKEIHGFIDFKFVSYDTYIPSKKKKGGGVICICPSKKQETNAPSSPPSTVQSVVTITSTKDIQSLHQPLYTTITNALITFLNHLRNRHNYSSPSINYQKGIKLFMSIGNMDTISLGQF